ncbi:hypothetical protein CLOM_g23702 [Closterium sp. NIES-68]|nr:hypothetical protein CLOM_g23702 [Closterium sp. NIES-68]GJP66469.1 hypothetical protein CLOP_g23399 [Closterium sp. NIES-67]
MDGVKPFRRRRSGFGSNTPIAQGSAKRLPCRGFLHRQSCRLAVSHVIEWLVGEKCFSTRSCPGDGRRGEVRLGEVRCQFPPPRRSAGTLVHAVTFHST